MKRIRLSLALAAICILVSILWLRAQADSQERDQRLAAAANAGNLLLVRALLSQGADPNALSHPGPSTPFWQQVWDPMYDRLPALTLAARRDADDIVETLLDHGANPDMGDNVAETPLMYAAIRARNTPRQIGVLNALLSHNANVNAQDRHGWTALMYAVFFHAAPDEIKILLSHGANPGIRDGEGHTAFWWARKSGNTGVVELLQNAAAAP